MDTQQNTALTRALAEVPGPLPARGVIHIVIPHTDRFTVVGNHLAQHPGISTTAVGFAVRIQSLPQGTEVGVKALAARYPEGEKLIAAALRELEAIGYLQRARTRLPDGRIVTRTVFCNQPAALLRPRTSPPPRRPQPPHPRPSPDRSCRFRPSPHRSRTPRFSRYRYWPSRLSQYRSRHPLPSPKRPSRPRPRALPRHRPCSRPPRSSSR